MLLLQVGTLSPSRNQVSNNNKYVHMCALSTHNDCTSPICFSKASYEITLRLTLRTVLMLDLLHIWGAYISFLPSQKYQQW